MMYCVSLQSACLHGWMAWCAVRPSQRRRLTPFPADVHRPQDCAVLLALLSSPSVLHGSLPILRKPGLAFSDAGTLPVKP